MKTSVDPHVVLVTGANGFLGRSVVSALRDAGVACIALVRDSAVAIEGIEAVNCDLSIDAAAEQLTQIIRDKNISSVVHLASVMRGTDEEHAVGTLKPMQAVISAISAVRPINGRAVPDLVLASSFSVYGYTGQPAGSMLDETTPTEGDGHRRDAYARAKLAQEALAMVAAQSGALKVRVLRPGAIVSERRPWTSRIGIHKGPVVVMFGGNAALPLIDVDECADAFKRGALVPITHSDIACAKGGAFEVINVVGDETPIQKTYLSHLRSAGVVSAKIVIPLPWKLLEKVTDFVGVCADLFPRFERMVPAFLRPEVLHARAKPLRYANARLRDRLGWVSGPEKQVAEEAI